VPILFGAVVFAGRCVILPGRVHEGVKGPAVGEGTPRNGVGGPLRDVDEDVFAGRNYLIDPFS
jgi:hypothetical protein